MNRGRDVRDSGDAAEAVVGAGHCTATTGRTEESAFKAPVVGTAQPEPSPMSATTSAMGQTKLGASEVSAVDVAIGQVFVPMTPMPAATN